MKTEGGSGGSVITRTGRVMGSPDNQCRGNKAETARLLALGVGRTKRGKSAGPSCAPPPLQEGHRMMSRAIVARRTVLVTASGKIGGGL